jgi:hypothetical protein
MLKTFAVGVLAISMFAGTAHARMAHKMGACAEGQVKASCKCTSSMSKQSEVCKAGQWCHTMMGKCMQ